VRGDLHASILSYDVFVQRDEITGELDQELAHSPARSIEDADNQSPENDPDAEPVQLASKEHPGRQSIVLLAGETDELDGLSLAPDLELGEDGTCVVKRKRAESSATESSPPKTGSSCEYQQSLKEFHVYS
jgi:hypothetical protein